MFEFRDLMKKISDNVLSEFTVSLLIIEPSEVLILQLQLVQLLIEAIERSGVALLVDEALAFSESLLELNLAFTESSDTVNFLLFLRFCFLCLASFLLGLLFSSFLDTCFSFLS